MWISPEAGARQDMGFSSCIVSFVCFRVGCFVDSVHGMLSFNLSRTADTKLQKAASFKDGENLPLPLTFFSSFFYFFFLFFFCSVSFSLANLFLFFFWKRCACNSFSSMDIAKYHSSGRLKTGMQDHLGIISKDLACYPSYPIWDSGRSDTGMDLHRLL